MQTSELDRVVKEWQRLLAEKDATIARELTRIFYNGYGVVKEELARLDRQFKKAQLGLVVERESWYYEQERYETLLRNIEQQLVVFSGQAMERAETHAIEALNLGDEFSKLLLELQLGEATQLPGISVKSASFEIMKAMVGLNREGSPLKKLLDSLVPDGVQYASDILIEAAMLGYNPRKVAPMLRDALGTILNRALTIARTEMMRATRIAAEQNYLANSDVVESWRWVAELDGITCPSCLAMHGTIHPTSERLNSHPNCRCVESPITISWEELGKRFGLDFAGLDGNTANVSELIQKYGGTMEQVARYYARQGTGKEYFETLKPEKQREILGKTRFNAYQSGVLNWDNLVQKTFNPDWGESIKLTPIKELFTQEELDEITGN